MLEIDGHSFAKGTKTQILFHPYGMQYDIPTTVICGTEPGMTMLVTAQIHAGEYNGSAAVMRLAEILDPAKLKGNLILMHCVNTSGFYQRQRRFVPEDRTDLNANYPGNPKGTLGNRIAAWFAEKIFPHIDFIADLHGGQDKHILECCAFYPRNCKVTEASFAAAKVLNSKYLIASSNASGEYGYAAHICNIPALLIECGYACVQTEAWILEQMDNVRKLLKHFDMYELEESRPIPRKINFKKSAYLMIDCKGVWKPNVEINKQVKKGELIGTVTDFFGNVLQRYYAEGDGIVAYYIAGMLVLDGDEAIAYGLLEDSEYVD